MIAVVVEVFAAVNGVLLATAEPTWAIVVPAVGSVAAFLALVGVFYPIRRDRRATAQSAADRNERLDATADVVLGRPADPSRYRAEIRPLTTVMADQFADLKKTVTDRLDVMAREQDRLGAEQTSIKKTVREHSEENDRRFSVVNDDIGGIRRQMNAGGSR